MDADLVEFRVLGPLEVVVDGEVRDLPSGAERAVLELLLVNAGRVVPIATLVDALLQVVGEGASTTEAALDLAPCDAKAGVQCRLVIGREQSTRTRAYTDAQRPPRGCQSWGWRRPGLGFMRRRGVARPVR